VDECYITGEEYGDDGRLFVLDSVNRKFYLLSGQVGWDRRSGNDVIPLLSWENAALLDTGEKSNIALLSSPDGGSEEMKRYMGRKGKDENCNNADSPAFLEQNGLPCCSWFYLTGTLPHHCCRHRERRLFYEQRECV
jgi:hypothetical protein